MFRIVLFLVAAVEDTGEIDEAGICVCVGPMMEQMSEHVMKSHTCRINSGVHGASWGKVVQNRTCSGRWRV